MSRLHIKRLLVPALLASCASAYAQTTISPARAGWIDDSCLVIDGAHLPAGSYVHVFGLDDQGTHTRAARIIAHTSDPAQCSALAADRASINASAGQQAYRLASQSPIVRGIGVVGPAITRQTPLDLDDDGNADQASACMTTEGISFRLWSATPYASPLLWSGYEYLGYDITPDCPQDEP